MIMMTQRRNHFCRYEGHSSMDHEFFILPNHLQKYMRCIIVGYPLPALVFVYHVGILRLENAKLVSGQQGTHVLGQNSAHGRERNEPNVLFVHCREKLHHRHAVLLAQRKRLSKLQQELSGVDCKLTLNCIEFENNSIEG